jgi:hypothetical protein
MLPGVYEDDGEGLDARLSVGVALQNRSLGLGSNYSLWTKVPIKTFLLGARSSPCPVPVKMVQRTNRNLVVRHCVKNDTVSQSIQLASMNEKKSEHQTHNYGKNNLSRKR